MAEFSKEYLVATGTDLVPDFSYITELIENPKKTEIFRICEGFGSIGVTLINDEPHLVYLDSKIISLKEAIENCK